VNKAELLKKVTEGKPYRTRAGEVEQIVNGTLEAIQAALARGEEVKLSGFGKFSAKAQAARQGRNPKTGEPIEIPAARRVRFSPGKGLLEAVNS
jgi:DNA-binding protein HU-beta